VRASLRAGGGQAQRLPRARERDGTLVTLVYGRAIAQNVDPVEKKPLSLLSRLVGYSIATAGCNFRCPWCQNWEISQLAREQHRIAGRALAPQQIVAGALRAGSRSLAYTYTEPAVFFEYAYATAQLAHAARLANIFVTNGYMTTEMLETLHPYLDAANVDLKAFREKTYHRTVGPACGRSGQPEDHEAAWNLAGSHHAGHPRPQRRPAELRDAARFVAQELGPDTPWHLSRFFPAYWMTDRPATPLATLQQAREIGLSEVLRHVYLAT
jgi:pyruvate formate lyase activating enzyme